MYYLQATVYENHGEYEINAYLWSHEDQELDVLLWDEHAYYRPLFTPEYEHYAALEAVSCVLSDLWGDAPEGHAGKGQLS